MEIIVTKIDVLQRLDQFVVQKLSESAQGISRSKIIRAIQCGDIVVNHHKQKSHYSIKLNDLIAIDDDVFAQNQESIVADSNVLLPIIFAHKHFFVINKPVGLQVHPSTQQEQGTLVQGLLAWDPVIASVGDDVQRPGIVHRLDRDTSGLLVVARTQEAFDALKKEFHNHRVFKEYYAVAHGVFTTKSGSINFPIARHTQGNRQIAVRTKRDGYRGVLRDAYTEYDVIQQYKGHALLSVRIQTGRTHQIRVHMLGIGHPVVGDQLYTYKGGEKVYQHHFLHAHTLGFRLFGQQYYFSAPLPQEWSNALKKIS